MKIGIDISQMAYENTGVANYLRNLVQALIKQDSDNEYILFYSNMRLPIQNSKFKIQNCNSKFKIKDFRFPPIFLDILWNRLHIASIEWFIGDVDIFITSDWTEPPVRRCKKATILYDLVVYKYPEESGRIIVSTQKRKLQWAKKETNIFFCISEATKKDAQEILKLPENKLKVIYPGLTLNFNT